MEKLLKTLSPRNLELAKILLLLWGSEEAVQGIWDEASEGITKQLKGINNGKEKR